MEDLLIAVLAGFAAGVLINKLTNKAKNVPVFKNDDVSNSDAILAEAVKAKNIGAYPASISLAFGAIEAKLRQLSENNEATYSVNRIVNDLIGTDVISQEITSVINELSKTRNNVVHGFEMEFVNELMVSNYLSKSENLLEVLGKAYNKSSKRDAVNDAPS